MSADSPTSGPSVAEVAGGWLPIATAPTDGTRVRVAHELDPSSLRVRTICPTRGFFREGEWVCDAGFICVDDMLRFVPTHWRPDDAHLLTPTKDSEQ